MRTHQDCRFLVRSVASEGWGAALAGPLPASPCVSRGKLWALKTVVPNSPSKVKRICPREKGEARAASGPVAAPGRHLGSLCGPGAGAAGSGCPGAAAALPASELWGDPAKDPGGCCPRRWATRTWRRGAGLAASSAATAVGSRARGSRARCCCVPCPPAPGHWPCCCLPGDLRPRGQFPHVPRIRPYLAVPAAEPGRPSEGPSPGTRVRQGLPSGTPGIEPRTQRTEAAVGCRPRSPGRSPPSADNAWSHRLQPSARGQR